MTKKEKNKKYLEETSEYYKIVKDILNNEEFSKRKNFPHHGEKTVMDHSLEVSILSYRIAKKLKMDYKSAAIGGLLHDFYNKPWQDDQEKRPFFKRHGFVHAREARENSKKYFPDLMTPRIENIILRHMFPLNITPPKYKEGWIITTVDKYVSMEIFKDIKNLPKYVGIGIRNKKGRNNHE